MWKLFFVYGVGCFVEVVCVFFFCVCFKLYKIVLLLFIDCYLFFKYLNVLKCFENWFMFDLNKDVVFWYIR